MDHSICIIVNGMISKSDQNCTIRISCTMSKECKDRIQKNSREYISEDWIHQFLQKRLTRKLINCKDTTSRRIMINYSLGSFTDIRHLREYSALRSIIRETIDDAIVDLTSQLNGEVSIIIREVTEIK